MEHFCDHPMHSLGCHDKKENCFIRLSAALPALMLLQLFSENNDMEPMKFDSCWSLRRVSLCAHEV